jgi:hypothetical protein
LLYREQDVRLVIIHGSRDKVMPVGIRGEIIGVETKEFFLHQFSKGKVTGMEVTIGTAFSIPFIKPGNKQPYVHTLLPQHGLPAVPVSV